MQIPRCARDDNWKAKAPAGGQRYKRQNPEQEQRAGETPFEAQDKPAVWNGSAADDVLSGLPQRLARRSSIALNISRFTLYTLCAACYLLFP